jgi:hypothetical protein
VRWVVSAVRKRIFAGRLACLFAIALLGLAGTASDAFAQPATFTSITSATSNPSVVGQPVTFFAFVTITGSFDPSGTVNFFDGATRIGSGAVGAQNAIFITSSLAIGSHTITAVYTGDANNAPSPPSPPVTQIVNQAATTTVVHSSLNPSTVGQTVTFTATVTNAGGGTPTPTGTVQFAVDGTNQGSPVPVNVAFATGLLTVGNHSITATYNGDSNNLGSSGALTQNVNQAATTTTLTSSLNPSTLGAPVTFTATVTNSGGGTPSPTGTVTYFDGPSLVASLPLTGGVATFTTGSLTTGNHTITAAYGGDSNNIGSSRQLTQNVTGAAPTITTANNTTFRVGVAGTFTVATTGSPTPTLSEVGALPAGVTFVDNGNGTAGLSGTPAAGTNGSYPLTITANNGVAPNATQTFTLTVNTTSTTTSLTSSLNPSVVGQVVTFTATVTSPGGTPTGGVTLNFGDGSAPATGTLAAGTVTFNHSYAASGNFTATATYSGNASLSPSSTTTTQQVSVKTSTTAVTSSLNPSVPGQAVTFSATVTGASPTGTVQFKDGAANLGTPVTLAGGAASLTTSALTSGSHSITAVYGGDGNNTASTSAPLTQRVNQSTTTTALTSSVNPSTPGQAVTFTATVTSGGGSPSGTVTFKDGATAIGSASLAGGVAALTISSLTSGSHSITAVYGGTASFLTSTSAVVIQAVSTPADSLKLRAMQALAAPVIAQNSGAAISGAIDTAISEGFSDSGTWMTPSGSGVRFNFSADPDGKPADTASRSTDPFSSANGSLASTGHGFTTQPSSGSGSASTSRVDDAFSALAYAAPTKAPPAPRYVEQRDWLGWAEVRGAVLDHWGSGTGAGGTVPGASMLYGSQVNLIAGLTRRLTPNFLVGVLGGYETFDYRSDALQGRLKGDGWTAGSYLGWKISQTLRFDAAVAYSGIGYDGTAGTASGNFAGDRWMVSSGLTGTYQGFGLMIEPSARIYALWEHENAYTDSLGTQQAERDFSTGRASAGVKVAYPIPWSSTVALAPYLGLYGDYYFNSDNATAALAQSGLPGAVVLEGFSARAVGGVTAKFANGGQIALGTEYSGIGGNASIWIYRARASVPF